MRKLTSVTAALLFIGTTSEAATLGIIPTSVALRLAKRIASDMRYDMSDRSVFFDQESRRNGRFVTINMYANERIIHSFAIHQDTGQVVDDLRCVTFDTPSARNFARHQQKLTGHRPIDLIGLAHGVGCDRLTSALPRG